MTYILELLWDILCKTLYIGLVWLSNLTTVFAFFPWTLTAKQLPKYFREKSFFFPSVLNTYHFVLYKVTHYFVVKVIYWCPSNSFLHVFFLLRKKKDSNIPLHRGCSTRFTMHIHIHKLCITHVQKDLSNVWLGEGGRNDPKW